MAIPSWQQLVTTAIQVLREKIQLKLIDLKENRIDDEGALALAQASAVSSGECQQVHEIVPNCFIKMLARV